MVSGTFAWCRHLESDDEHDRSSHSGMLKALRLARIYGFMVERRDGLYYPGSNLPACPKALAEKMVEGGWLVKQGERYQPTEKGWKAGEAG